MTLRKKLNSKRGFTLAELLIVVAIIAILAGIAFIFVNPQDISYVEYNRSAEAIATAVQNRLTEIRNAGDMEKLRALGVQSSQSEETGKGEKTANSLGGESGDGTYGGYRYVFNYSVGSDGTAIKADMGYLLPFGAIEYELAKNYYAIGFQSDTGMVGEVFYTVQPFNTDALTADYLVSLAGNPEKRKAENVGYYKGNTYDSEMAFANLPTPQLTITNYEELTLSIYLPQVKQLSDYGKNLGILVSLSDEAGKAFEGGLTLNQTAIYSTFSLGNSSSAIDVLDPQPISVEQKISSGTTYNIILDTVKKCGESDIRQTLSSPVDDKEANITPPKAKFESWAKRSKAFKDGYYLLGDNSTVTVTVYCLYQAGDKNYDKDFPVNPTFMPRSASVTFNGWFNHYSDGSVDIACGRHLQNLGKLAEMRSTLKKYLPTSTKEADGSYTYGDFDYGMANTYTEGSSHSSPTLSTDDIKEKYLYRENIVQKNITRAKQVNAIDFNCPDWMQDGKRIPFEPICLPKDFRYYGNYLTISNLYVDTDFYAGLFGYAYHYRLYDILLVNPSVTSHVPIRIAELYEIGVGALIGTSRDSDHINNCQTYMTPDATGYPDNRVAGTCYVGGLIGFCEDEHIENCSASVNTGYGAEDSSLSRYVGGLIGCITGDSSIDNCYAAGNLRGEYVGGLVGFIVEDSDPTGDDYRIGTCYTAGHIEYAAQEAAGLLGHISELAGNVKSALSIHGNYCVVIYGTLKDGEYQWDDTIPIYGTFKGDGFEWLGTDQLGFYDTYLKGSYNNITFFAGAVFDDDNRNYYIAQRDIKYHNSPYFESMKSTVEQFYHDIESAGTESTLETEIEAAQEEIFWSKKLQTLEELDLVIRNIINEVENEKGLDPNKHPYNQGGYYYETKVEVLGPDGKVLVDDKGKPIMETKPNGTPEFYLDQNRAEFEPTKTTSHNSVKLNVLQGLHAIYEGTYTADDGTTQTVKLTYEGSGDHPGWKDYVKSFVFKDIYNELRSLFETMRDGKGTEQTKEMLYYYLGMDKNDPKDGTSNAGPCALYGFYDRLLNKVLDHAKDYYEKWLGDEVGELIYRRFRGFSEGKFRELLYDLCMSAADRDAMLVEAKVDELTEAEEKLNGYYDIINIWEEKDGTHPMAEYASTARADVADALAKLAALKTAVQTYKLGTKELEAAINAAETSLQTLKALFDTHKAEDEDKDTGDWDAVDATGKKGDMRKLRSDVDNYRKVVALCRATANSGVESALSELKIKLGENGADRTALLHAFEDKMNAYLGADWEKRDSGHRLYNATQLRNVVRGYKPDGNKFVDSSGKEVSPHGLGFMYDYGNKYDDNPYLGEMKGDYYVDQDNGVYNNVFPYTETNDTRYYPFPFVFGRNVENGERAVFVLFHYGDWLTKDLWAEE